MKSGFLLSLLFAISIALPAQNFEYALSQEDFDGSAINDLEIVGDKIILAGGAGSWYAACLVAL